MKRIISNGVCIIVGILFAHPAFSEEAWQVTQKAWDAFAKKNYYEVERLANDSVRRWGEHAREMNNGLSTLPSSKEAKQ